MKTLISSTLFILTKYGPLSVVHRRASFPFHRLSSSSQPDKSKKSKILFFGKMQHNTLRAACECQRNDFFFFLCKCTYFKRHGSNNIQSMSHTNIFRLCKLACNQQAPQPEKTKNTRKKNNVFHMHICR